MKNNSPAVKTNSPEECNLIQVWQSPEMIKIIRKWTPISLLIKPNNS